MAYPTFVEVKPFPKIVRPKRIPANSDFHNKDFYSMFVNHQLSYEGFDYKFITHS